MPNSVHNPHGFPSHSVPISPSGNAHRWILSFSFRVYHSVLISGTVCTVLMSLSTNPLCGPFHIHGQGVSRFANFASVFLTFKHFVPQNRKHKSSTGVVDGINHKLCRFLIDNQQSTVILHRWICVDHRYRPRPKDRVDTSVDRCRYLDRCWDHFSSHMGPRLIGGWVSGTISHHLWDQGQWSFFWTYRENSVNRFFFVMNPHWRLISTDFFGNWRSMRYQPYFQVGESALTVDVKRILK